LLFYFHANRIILLSIESITSVRAISVAYHFCVFKLSRNFRHSLGSPSLTYYYVPLFPFSFYCDLLFLYYFSGIQTSLLLKQQQQLIISVLHLCFVRLLAFIINITFLCAGCSWKNRKDNFFLMEKAHFNLCSNCFFCFSLHHNIFKALYAKPPFFASLNICINYS
jgi:hypothetical protein